MARGEDTRNHPNRQVARGRYQIHGEAGGGTLWTSPSKDQEGRHNIVITTPEHVRRLEVRGAEFSHDPETDEARFLGGIDAGSGQPFKGEAKIKTFGGNIMSEEDRYRTFD